MFCVSFQSSASPLAAARCINHPGAFIIVAVVVFDELAVCLATSAATSCASLAYHVFHLVEPGGLFLNRLKLLHHLGHVTCAAANLAFHLGELLLQCIELGLLRLESVTDLCLQRLKLCFDTILIDERQVILFRVIISLAVP